MSGMPEARRQQRLWERAERFLAEKNFDAARITLEALVSDQSGHIMARLRLSTLATAQGRYRDSVAQLLSIAELQPADADLLSMLAAMLHRLGETRAALSCVMHPAFERVDDKQLLEEMAQLASQLEDSARAEFMLDRADRLGGASSNSLYTRASLQLFRGDLELSELTLESCLARAPDHAQALWALSRLRVQTAQHNHVAQLQRARAGKPDPISSVYLAFALFKELDDLGRGEEAWDALMLGCAGKRQQLLHQADDEEAVFAELHAMRGPAAARDPAALYPEPAPIFIVGMPRTGTTLLERILGRHGSVENAGELDDMPLQLRWIANRFSKSYLDAAVVRAAASQAPELLASRYMDHARWRARGKSFFTDKMPLNFLHVGFIAKALPQARILHMVRNPMDTCFSNLKELFTEVYPYSYDLDELADHYGRYRRLMAHWQQQFPGCVLDVSYESLVTEPEATSKMVMDFCGLDWQPECVGIESSAGSVSTASSVQVREPIHRKAIDGWRKYERQLEPLRRKLRADGWLPQ